MLTVKLDRQFKKDLKRDQKCGKYTSDDFNRLKAAMDILIEAQELDESYLPHPLIGAWRGYWECHIKPNWLLIYKQESKVVKFARLGTHQQLFKKY
jgi:mRNA interferase YafQ